MHGVIIDGEGAEIGYWVGQPFWGQGFAGEAVRLHFSKLFGMKVTVWLDGQLIEHRDLPRYFWFDYNHSNEFDLTEVVTPGAAQTLTVRVFKEFDWGGPYGAVFLYSPKDAGTALEGAE